VAGVVDPAAAQRPGGSSCTRTTAAAKPIVQRVGTRRTASTDVAATTAPIRYIWAGPRVTPSTAPPSTSGRYMPASPRAWVTPPIAPISAARAARLSDSPGTSMYPPLLASTRPGTDAGSDGAAHRRLSLAGRSDTYPGPLKVSILPVAEDHRCAYRAS
jgi:hypothetical protein